MFQPGLGHRAADLEVDLEVGGGRWEVDLNLIRT
jgi:hypothetical protein